MKHANAISSIISTTFLEELIKDKFKFATKVTCKVIRIGINHTYLIQTVNEQFVLRVYTYEWRTETEIREELQLLIALKDYIKISYPIPDLSGNDILKINAIEGERYAVLFAYAKGASIRNLPETLCFKLGVQMAKLHQLTINKSLQRKNYTPEVLVNSSYLLAKDFFSEMLEEVSYLKTAYEEISSQFLKAKTSQLRSGIVHLDIWSDNLKVDKDSNITLFDFDNCGNGYLFLDIGYTLMILFKEERDKTLYKQKIKKFYEGYESLCLISDEEKKLIPYGGLAIWLHYTGIHIKRFDDFSNSFFNKRFLKQWIDFGKTWMTWNSQNEPDRF